jgi:general stress protein YciG
MRRPSPPMKLRPSACASKYPGNARLAPISASHARCASTSGDLQLEYCGRRRIMADERNNQGELDERSRVGGSDEGSSEARTDNNGESRNTGTVRKTPRGFAAMDPQAQRAIAAKGGRAAHQKGTAHEFTSEEARVAGRKGGEASRGGRRSSGADQNRS